MLHKIGARREDSATRDCRPRVAATDASSRKGRGGSPGARGSRSCTDRPPGSVGRPTTSSWRGTRGRGPGGRTPRTRRTGPAPRMANYKRIPGQSLARLSMRSAVVRRPIDQVRPSICCCSGRRTAFSVFPCGGLQGPLMAFHETADRNRPFSSDSMLTPAMPAGDKD